MSKIDVLIFTTSEGHISIAQAAHQHLEANAIRSQVAFFPEPAMNLYKLLYRYNPRFFYVVFNLFYYSFMNALLRRFLHLQHDRQLEQYLQEHRPKVVINTSLGFTPTLEKLHHKFGYYFINVLPNPRTFFPQDLADKADVNIVFDQHQATTCQRLKPQAKTLNLGWLVRGDFEQQMSSKAARQKLNLPADARTVLITSGSEGVQSVREIVAGLGAEQLPPTTIIVACGSNTLLRYQIQRLARRFNREDLQIHALAFTDQMPLYMQAADIVVGKAGPNTLFESVAARRPFVATTYIAGQETGNLEIIKEYNLGYVALESHLAVSLLTELLTHPDKLVGLRSALEAMADKNLRAKDELVKLVAQQLG